MANLPDGGGIKMKVNVRKYMYSEILDMYVYLTSFECSIESYNNALKFRNSTGWYKYICKLNCVVTVMFSFDEYLLN